MNTENLARRYYRLINDKDLEGVLALMASDVVFDLPDGRKVEVEALREMYVGVFSHGGPQPQPVSIVTGESNAAAEVEVKLADGSVRKMASFFYAGWNGKLERVAVYQRS